MHISTWGNFMRIFNLILLSLSLPLVGQSKKQSPPRTPSRTAVPSFKPGERQAAESALKELRKIQTAIKVGITKIEYGKQVVEMAQAVEEHLIGIPDGSMKQLISETEERYIAANQAWVDSISSEFISIFFSTASGKNLFEKYGLREKALNQNYDKNDKYRDLYKISEHSPILQPLWSAAKRRLIVATELLKRNINKDPSAIKFITSLDNYERAKLAGEPTEELLKEIPNWMGLLDSILDTQFTQTETKGSPSTQLLKVIAEFSPGTLDYSGRIEAGGRSISISMNSVTSSEGAAWVVDRVTKVEGQEFKESTTYAKGSLLPLKASLKQGPMIIETTFADGKATGTTAMGGTTKAFSVDLSGELYAHGAGSSACLACLPLADGYSATYTNFNAQKQKPTRNQVRVVGSEAITVAAGAFLAWKVELVSSADEPSATYWVDKASRKVLQYRVVQPGLSGAVITFELQP